MAGKQVAISLGNTGSHTMLTVYFFVVGILSWLAAGSTEHPAGLGLAGVLAVVSFVMATLNLILEIGTRVPSTTRGEHRDSGSHGRA
ncbi:MAG: hypothetical protein U1F43_07220 [Myxococcota bacterium]